MTPEIENVMRNQGRQCVDEIRHALKAKPKRNGMRWYRQSSKSTTKKLSQWASALRHSSAALAA
ncbi:hypothetical protein ACRAOD_16760 [Raoultella ornithinolytica]|uniref:hypothetical protein n=1 Tax=Raoultella ornithinolytica TaxID=54291 RepID=UPI003703C027